MSHILLLFYSVELKPDPSSLSTHSSYYESKGQKGPTMWPHKSWLYSLDPTSDSNVFHHHIHRHTTQTKVCLIQVHRKSVDSLYNSSIHLYLDHSTPIYDF